MTTAEMLTLVIGGVAGLAAIAAAVWTRSQARTAEGARKASLPSVEVEAFIERPRRRVRVILTNSGGAQVTVSRVAVVRASAGSAYRDHQVVATALVEPAPQSGAQAPPQGAARRVVLNANDVVEVTLRRVHDERFDDHPRLRVLVDVAGRPPEVVPLQPLENAKFFVPGLDPEPPR